ncbi:MAG: GtrA family protein [Bacteroidales bacterium]|nr:GtrA family protein [Lentimicrobiaceae bacterium]MDD5695630.1 GtrA family protein [Bacteroidales bacterium]
MIERLFVFAKAQASAFFGGMTDYLVMILFTEIFHVHYTLSIAIGGVVGAIVNFTINKTWTFHSKSTSYEHSGWVQFFRFALVVLNSIVLKSSGTFFFTTILKTNYIISRVMTDLTVSLLFNFMLQKYWVFQKKRN